MLRSHLAGMAAALAPLVLLVFVAAGQAAGQPDLAVTVAPTQDLPAGSDVPVAVTLWNLGTIGSPSASVLVSVDGNPTDPPLDFGPLAPGASQTLQAAFALGCGAHAIGALADPADLVNESLESNNGAAATARVVPVPSFQLQVSHAPDGHTLSLDASATTGCRPLAFDWAVVPGGSAEGEVTSRPVPAGNVTVTLTVTSIGDPSIHASAWQTLFVNNIPPWVSASIPGSPILTGAPSGLSVNATDVDGSVVTTSVEMGDGFTTTSLAEAALHAYARRGTYTVVVTVTDNLGNSNETIFDHTVLNRPPVARVVPVTASGEVGTAVELSGVLSSDPENTTLSYSWSFGDGTTGSGLVVNHAYNQPGQYLVTVTVTDEDGGQSNATATVTVAPRAGAEGFGPEVPLLFVAAFAIAAGVSFAGARRLRRKGQKRSPPPPRAGTRDRPARRSREEE